MIQVMFKTLVNGRCLVPSVTNNYLYRDHMSLMTLVYYLVNGSFELPQVLYLLLICAYTALPFWTFFTLFGLMLIKKNKMRNSQ